MAVKEQIPELTGLRGLAALAVILNHFLLLLPQLNSTPAIHVLGPMGNIGMSLFFVLSGVVIYYNYYDRVVASPARQATIFLVHRFARLYPLYFLFVIGCFIFYTLDTHSKDVVSSNIATLPMFLLGVQTWTYGFVGSREILYWQENANITWSISTELFFYFCFIFLAVFVYKKISKRVLLSIFIILCIRVVYLVLVLDDSFSSYIHRMYDGYNNGVLGSPDYYWLYFIYHSPYFRIFEFIAGCLIGKYISTEKNVLFENNLTKIVLFLLATSVAILIAKACGIIHIFNISITYAEFACIPIFIIFFVFYCVVKKNKILRSKVFLFMGEVSYSSYLIHILVIDFIGRNFSNIYMRILLFVFITYALSFVIWKYYEIPCKNKVKNFLLKECFNID